MAEWRKLNIKQTDRPRTLEFSDRNIIHVKTSVIHINESNELMDTDREVFQKPLRYKTL